MYRFGVDIGGTFTDLVIQSADTGLIRTIKVPSTPVDPAQAVLDALRSAAGMGIDLERVTQLIHSTTVASNTILQGVGARTGLLVTKGFRDILDIRRHKRYELFNASYRKLPPLAPRELTFGIGERLDAKGSVIEALDEGEVSSAAQALAAANVESVAICFLFSFVNDVHERRAEEILREHLPGCFISRSSAIYPQYREYERASTTVVNCYLGPRVSRYIDRLSAEVDRLGMKAPLQLMQSNGGIITAPGASATPCRIVESGPAAGVIAAAYFASLLGRKNVIAFDMGGTTAKAGVIQEGKIRLAAGQEIGTGVNLSRLLQGGGYFVGAATVDLAEVGAGGGSIVRVDEGQMLKVGPESAGAVPGPICYAKGGERVTVTDANVLLNRIPADHFLGGKMPLDVGGARTVVERDLAKPLNVSAEEVCAAIIEIANANMLKMLRIVSVEQGYDPRDFCMVPSGGSGPVHAVELAEELGIREVIVPPAPGLLSSQGLLSADVRFDFRRTFIAKLAELLPRDFEAVLTELHREADAALSHYDISGGRTDTSVSADLRYQGQAYELNIPFRNDEFDESARAAMTEAFHRSHENVYGRRDPQGEVQIVGLMLTVIRRVAPVLHPEIATAEGPPEPIKRAPTWFSGQLVESCPCYDRAALRSGHHWEGPAVVAGQDSTILVPPGWMARCDRYGNILIELNEA